MAYLPRAGGKVTGGNFYWDEPLHFDFFSLPLPSVLKRAAHGAFLKYSTGKN
jgi:hypothetical protein